MLEISLVVFGNLTIVSKKSTDADIVKIFATSVLTTAKCWSWVRLEICTRIKGQEISNEKTGAFDSSKNKCKISALTSESNRINSIKTLYYVKFSIIKDWAPKKVTIFN